MTGHAVSVRVPCRIDFAGGWTDVPDFSGEEGGAVLNAAVEPYVEGSAEWDGEGLRLTYRLALPPDSHLGTSSATNLAWLELIAGLTGRTAAPADMAERAWQLEALSGEKGGKQDQYAAALGGINLLRFRGVDDPVEVEPVRLSPGVAAALEARLLLCDSGPSEDSGAQHEEVWRRFQNGDEGVRSTLRAIRDTVDPARDALMAGDWPRLGTLMTRNRELARALGGGAVTDATDRLFAAAADAGALGGKPCGAGGGGFLIILCGDDREKVRQALETAGGRVRPASLAARRDASH